jgi:hypothetical protein
MSPQEVTRVFVYELRPERLRAPSPFEIDWYKDTHALLARSS